MVKPRKKNTVPDAPKDDPPAEPQALVATVSQETLEDTPARVLSFLKGVGTTAAIFAALRARGYTAEEHAHGWRLFDAASGRDQVGRGIIDASDPSISEAIVELDAADEPFVRILRASLGRRFPDIAEMVLGDVKPSTGMGAVVVVDTVLTGISKLERSDHPKRAEALQLIADRRYPPETRERFRKLVTAAQSVPDIVPADLESLERMEKEQTQRLIALRMWYEEWAEIAKTTIKRRSHLIRLGLASRRKKASPPATDNQGSNGEDEATE
jgi:hypothetical protein